MIQQTYKDIVKDELLVGTLDHNPHTGFLEDYRVLSCLLKIHEPKSLFEIGTNVGGGINVMKAALPQLEIFSLDLDYATMRLNSKQYPIGPDGTDKVGINAKGKYTQLRGDSMKFNYSQYPCEAYYIDGEHDTLHAAYESLAAFKLSPKIIIWHDSDMPPVMDGIQAAFKKYSKDYELYRVTDTRIAYAVRK